MKTIITIGLLMTSFFNTINAQKWIKTSAPTNIRYKGIRTYGNNTIYAYGISGTDNVINTLVSSFDGGQTWTVGSIPFLYTIYLVATPAGLFAGDGTFKNPTSNYTNDGGQTWNKVTGTESGYFVPVGVLPNSKLLYGDQIYKALSVSEDYVSLGTTYNTSVTPDFINFAVNPSGRIIFGHSDNHGYDLAYSDNNGETLTNISLKSIIGAGTQAPKITFAGNNTFYASGVNTDVLKSTDNGITWASCSPITAGAYITSIKANSAGRLIVSKTGNVFVTSIDGGQTFTNINDGLPTNGGGVLETTTDGKFWLSYEDSAGTVKSGGIYVLENYLSVNDLSKDKIHVFPNPVKDILHINLPNNIENKKIDLYSSTGIFIRQIELNSNFEINVSNLPKGIYFLKSQSKGNNSVIKFIKN